jgi:hypothetical protein
MILVSGKSIQHVLGKAFSYLNHSYNIAWQRSGRENVYALYKILL